MLWVGLLLMALGFVSSVFITLGFFAENSKESLKNFIIGFFLFALTLTFAYLMGERTADFTKKAPSIIYLKDGINITCDDTSLEETYITCHTGNKNLTIPFV